jgi:hypothetical protein
VIERVADGFGGRTAREELRVLRLEPSAQFDGQRSAPMPPGASSAVRQCSTLARKRRPLMAPSSSHGAMMRLWRRPARGWEASPAPYAHHSPRLPWSQLQRTRNRAEAVASGFEAAAGHRWCGDVKLRLSAPYVGRMLNEPAVALLRTAVPAPGRHKREAAVLCTPRGPRPSQYQVRSAPCRRSSPLYLRLRLQVAGLLADTFLNGTLGLLDRALSPVRPSVRPFGWVESVWAG